MWIGLKPKIEGVDEEGRDGRGDHQHHPELAEKAVKRRTLAPPEKQEGADHGSRQDRRHVDLHGKRCGVKWFECHRDISPD